MRVPADRALLRIPPCDPITKDLLFAVILGANGVMLELEFVREYAAPQKPSFVSAFADEIDGADVLPGLDLKKQSGAAAELEVLEVTLEIATRREPVVDRPEVEDGVVDR